jgi:prepilin-type N-terminal cleavage/methylation domain-containing protein
MTRKSRSPGFTLLEIIVVLALMGVVSTLGMVMFSRLSDLWKQTTVRTDLAATANAVFREMRQDFGQVVSPKLSGSIVKGTTRAASDSRFFRVSLDDDQVVIPVETVAGPDGRLQRLDVKYYIDRKDGAATLMRSMSVPGGAETASVKVAGGVLAMAIEYSGKGPAPAWKREWKEAGPPSAVRVSVTLMDSTRPYEQIASKAVFPIEVN